MSDQYFYKQQRLNRQKLDWKCLFRKKSDPGRPQSLQRKVNYYKNKRLQCFFAELLATGLYVMIGDGATSQVIIGRYLSGTMLNQTAMDPSHVDYLLYGNFISMSLAFGFGLAAATAIAGGISGGHINPAVTFVCAIFGRTKWGFVPFILLGQYIGAFLGAIAVYALHAQQIHEFDLYKPYISVKAFATFPNVVFQTSNNNWNKSLNLIWDQLWGTAFIVIIYFACTDKRGAVGQSKLGPVYIGIGMMLIVLVTGVTAGTAINPARDFMPRVLMLMCGFGKEVFRDANYFFWIPLLVPHLGALLGALLYHLFIGWMHPVEKKKEEEKISKPPEWKLKEWDIVEEENVWPPPIPKKPTPPPPEPGFKVGVQVDKGIYMTEEISAIGKDPMQQRKDQHFLEKQFILEGRKVVPRRIPRRVMKGTEKKVIRLPPQVLETRRARGQPHRPRPAPEPEPEPYYDDDYFDDFDDDFDDDYYSDYSDYSDDYYDDSPSPPQIMFMPMPMPQQQQSGQLRTTFVDPETGEKAMSMAELEEMERRDQEEFKKKEEAKKNKLLKFK